MELQIDNWRWAGVPFYLRTGKRLAKRSTEIVIQFKRAPHIVFREREVEDNRLVLIFSRTKGFQFRSERNARTEMGNRAVR